MAKLTAAEFQEKHARRLKAATEDMRKGVMAVTKSPTAAAADKKEKMRANLTAALDSGKWEKGLRRVTLEDWKKKMVDVGVARVASGIDGAKAKTIAFADQLLPHIDSVQAEIKKLPDVTLEDSINRMTTFVRGMAKFQRK